MNTENPEVSRRNAESVFSVFLGGTSVPSVFILFRFIAIDPPDDPIH
jgi:hypothetical protein